MIWKLLFIYIWFDSAQAKEYPFYGDIVLPGEKGIKYLRVQIKKWPDGKIPYEIEENSYNDEQRQKIIDAVNDLNARITNLKIVPRRDEEDYVFVKDGDNCQSDVGRATGRQDLSLAKESCLHRRSIQHEFLHAAGLFHEHNRMDRDKYVKVLFKNIPKSSWNDYKKNKHKDPSMSFGPYDYCSVMHYHLLNAKTRKPAFKILRPDIDTDCMGKELTDIDIQKINKLYS